jgi:hypothetical protein
MKTLLTSLFALTAILSTGCAQEAIDLDDRAANMDILLDGAAEACGEYEVGESWEPDSCNVCNCTGGGVACTVVECNDEINDFNVGYGSEELDGAYFPYEMVETPICDDHEFGDMWMEDCNLCNCGPNGVECTRKDCSETIPH